MGRGRDGETRRGGDGERGWILCSPNAYVKKKIEIEYMDSAIGSPPTPGVR